jgi:hypothetical protein
VWSSQSQGVLLGVPCCRCGSGAARGTSKKTDGGLGVVGEWCRGVGDPGAGVVCLPPLLGWGSILSRGRSGGI